MYVRGDATVMMVGGSSRFGDDDEGSCDSDGDDVGDNVGNNALG
jgi:hypothetical protein